MASTLNRPRRMILALKVSVDLPHFSGARARQARHTVSLPRATEIQIDGIDYFLPVMPISSNSTNETSGSPVVDFRRRHWQKQSSQPLLAVRIVIVDACRMMLGLFARQSDVSNYFLWRKIHLIVALRHRIIRRDCPVARRNLTPIEPMIVVICGRQPEAALIEISIPSPAR